MLASSNYWKFGDIIGSSRGRLCHVWLFARLSPADAALHECAFLFFSVPCLCEVSILLRLIALKQHFSLFTAHRAIKGDWN